MRIMPNFFLIRINKENQRKFKEKAQGSSLIYQPQTAIFNTKNMECGEIVQIGSRILSHPELHGTFDNVKVGDTLITHWSIEGNPPLYEDLENRYYLVDHVNIRGYYDGKQTIPHPAYVFLKNESAFEKVGEYDHSMGIYINKLKSGLYQVSGWENSATATAMKIEGLKMQIESLSKTDRFKFEGVQEEIEKLGREQEELNRESKKKAYLPYKMAISNKIFDRDCGTKIKENDIVFCLNDAAKYICNFKTEPYEWIICRTDYIGCVDNRAKTV